MIMKAQLTIKLNTIFKKEATSAKAVFMRVLYQGRIEIWKCWFLGREGNQRTGEKPLEEG